ncbi:MAG: ATP-binding protein [Candidatus Hydrogenedentes bacterium]|nr:ATP-binding protein [Candidatus Hydrogenedentota bacterium]
MNGAYIGPLQEIADIVYAAELNSDAEKKLELTEGMLKSHLPEKRKDTKNDYLRKLEHKDRFADSNASWVLWIANDSPYYAAISSIKGVIDDPLREVYILLLLHALMPAHSEKVTDFLMNRMRVLSGEACDETLLYQIRTGLTEDNLLKLPPGLRMQPKEAISKLDGVASTGLKARMLRASIMDFTKEIENECKPIHHKGALARIRSFLEGDGPAQFLILVGSAGWGKSAIITHFLKHHNAKTTHVSTLIPFLIKWDETLRSEAVFVWQSLGAALQILTGQLLDEKDRPADRPEIAFNNFKCTMDRLREENDQVQPPDWKPKSAKESCNEEKHIFGRAYPNRITLVVDALDELNPSSRPLLDDLVTIDNIPARIRFIFTCRPDSAGLSRFLKRAKAKAKVIDLLDGEGKKQRDAIKRYFEAEFVILKKEAPTPVRIELLVQRSEGSFLYATLVARDIIEVGGRYDFTNVPRGLHEQLENKEWARLMKGPLDPGKTSRLLAAVAAIRGPCELELVAESAGIQLSEIERFLQVHGYLFLCAPDQDGAYRAKTRITGYRHQSIHAYFVEHKLGEAAIRRAHGFIVTAFQRWWGSRHNERLADSGYYFEHIVNHFLDANEVSRLMELLTDSPDWLLANETVTGSTAHGLRDIASVCALLPKCEDAVTIRRRFKLRAAQRFLEQRNVQFDDDYIEILAMLGKDSTALGLARGRTGYAARITALLAVIRAFRAIGRPFDQLLTEAEALSAHLQMSAKADLRAWVFLMEEKTIGKDESDPVAGLFVHTTPNRMVLALARVAGALVAKGEHQQAVEVATRFSADSLHNAAYAGMAFVCGRDGLPDEALKLVDNLSTINWKAALLESLISACVERRDYPKIIKAYHCFIELYSSESDDLSRFSANWDAVQVVIRPLIRAKYFHQAISFILFTYCDSSFNSQEPMGEAPSAIEHTLSQALETVTDRLTVDERVPAELALALVAVYGGCLKTSTDILGRVLTVIAKDINVGLPWFAFLQLQEIALILCKSNNVEFAMKDVYQPQRIVDLYIAVANRLIYMNRLQHADDAILRAVCIGKQAGNDWSWETTITRLVRTCIKISRIEEARSLIQNKPRLAFLLGDLAVSVCLRDGLEAAMTLIEDLPIGANRNYAILLIVRSASMVERSQFADAILQQIAYSQVEHTKPWNELLGLSTTLLYLGYHETALNVVRRISDSPLRVAGLAVVAENAMRMGRSTSARRICLEAFAEIRLLPSATRVRAGFAIAAILRRTGHEREADRRAHELCHEISAMEDDNEVYLSSAALCSYYDYMDKSGERTEFTDAISKFALESVYTPRNVRIHPRSLVISDICSELRSRCDDFFPLFYYGIAHRPHRRASSLEALSARWDSLKLEADTVDKIEAFTDLATQWIARGNERNTMNIYEESVVLVERLLPALSEHEFMYHPLMFTLMRLCKAMVRDGFYKGAESILNTVHSKVDKVCFEPYVVYAMFFYGNLSGGLAYANECLAQDLFLTLSYGSATMERLKRGLFIEVIEDMTRIKEWTTGTVSELMKTIQKVVANAEPRAPIYDPGDDCLAQHSNRETSPYDTLPFELPLRLELMSRALFVPRFSGRGS